MEKERRKRNLLYRRAPALPSREEVWKNDWLVSKAIIKDRRREEIRKSMGCYAMYICMYISYRVRDFPSAPSGRSPKFSSPSSGSLRPGNPNFPPASLQGKVPMDRSAHIRPEPVVSKGKHIPPLPLTRPKGPQCPLPATVRVKFPAISGFDTCLVSISCPPFGLERNFPSTPLIWLVLPVCVSPARPELEFPVRAGASRSRRQPCLLNLG